MRKKKILLVAAALLAVFAVIVQAQEASFAFQRSIQIDAAPSTVYPLFADFRQWTRWSSWDKEDRSIERTFSGPTSAVGSAYAWAGNFQTGAGDITIVDAKANESARMWIQFRRPWRSGITIEFALRPTSTGGSELVWKLWGEANFGAKASHLFMNVDRMVGAVFEPSLANIKALAEAEDKKRATDAAATKPAATPGGDRPTGVAPAASSP